MAYPVDEVSLKQIFDEFDADKSGLVDAEEIKKMGLSLGIVFSDDELQKMIKEADVDGNGEIDFEEFKAIVDMATKSATSTGTGFGALALRKKNTGPPMKWSTKKAGPGLVVEGDTVSYPPSKEPSKGQYSVQLLDVLCNASQLDAASVLLECTALAPGSYIGVVSSNFQRSDWNEKFEHPHAVAVRTDGKVFRKQQNLAPIIQLSELSSGGHISMDLDMQGQEMVITVLDANKKKISSVSVDQLPVEVACAVCFAPSETAQSIKVIGSSSEKTGKKRVKTFGADVWDDDNVQKISSDAAKRRNSAVDVAASMG